MSGNLLSPPITEEKISTKSSPMYVYLNWAEELTKQLNSSESKSESVFNLPKLPDSDPTNPVGYFFETNQLSPEQQVIIVLLLLDHYFPETLLPFIKLFTNEHTRGMVGGRLNEHTKLYEPSLQSALFILSGGDTINRVMYSHLLEEANNSLFTDGIIEFKYSDNRGIKAPLKLNDDCRLSIMGNAAPRLDSGDNFPARLATTKLSFDEVILGPKTQEGLKPLFRYLSVRKKIKESEELTRLAKPCYMTVFSGFPGTGKTIAAKTIGKLFGMPTYTLELSRVVSKYIGEFEKAMDKVFSRFSGKDCILFIDEADSIFTKRLENIAEAKDKYVNQEMAYLLQRLEDYDGVVILASNVANFKQQIDNAMLRRIRNFVQFPFPLFEERLKLWHNALPKSIKYEEGLIEKLAENLQLTGASIYSIVSELILYILSEDLKEITYKDIAPFIESDFRKRDITMLPCKDSANATAVMTQRVGKQVMSTGKRM